MNRADLLALSDERDRWMARLIAAERAAYAAGREQGHREGYAQCDRDRDAGWYLMAHPIAHGPVDLMARRWGEGGREHFGDPRPDDFPGREMVPA